MVTDRKGRGGGDKEESGRLSVLTQDEVVLSQLCVPDLFVEGAAGVQIHVSHEAAAVEVLPDLPQSEGRNRPFTTRQQHTSTSGRVEQTYVNGATLVAYLLSVLLTGGSYRYHHDLRRGEPERPGTTHLDYEKVSRKGRGG